MSVNRTELVAQIAERADLTKAKADEALAAFQAVLVESLAKGEAVKVTGLLSVERVERAARTGRNPRTGEEIDHGACTRRGRRRRRDAPRHTVLAGYDVVADSPGSVRWTQMCTRWGMITV